MARVTDRVNVLSKAKRVYTVRPAFCIVLSTGGFVCSSGGDLLLREACC